MQRLLSRYWIDPQAPSADMTSEPVNSTEYDFSLEQSMAPTRDKVTHLHLFLFYVVGILYYLTAAINPVLYNVMSRDFRRAFLRIFRCSVSTPASRPSIAATASPQRSWMPF